MKQQNRKDEHIKLFNELYNVQENDFDAVRFVHHSFPEISIDQVDLSTSIGPIQLNYPIFINAMTGGSQQTKTINEQLATVAKAMNIPMATGSMSVILKHPETLDSFRVIRKVNPDGIVVANIGAGHGPEDAKRVVELIGANALQIHINAPQELVMPEGDRDFSNWLKNIERTVKAINVPVIVKEVGFGMSRETIEQLVNVGVTIVDVSGRGGTNFIQIENERRVTKTFSYLYDWGQSTVISLLEADNVKHQVDVISSGGIRNMLDVVKSLALGAMGVGISGRYLHHLFKYGVESLAERIHLDLHELRVIYTMLGCSNRLELQMTDLIFDEEIRTWCESRGLKYTNYGNRSSIRQGKAFT